MPSRRDSPIPPAGATGFESEAYARLKALGYRWTDSRRLVVGALARAGKPLNAYAVRDAIRASGRKVDVVTVYRILATLADAGLVHRISVAEGYVPCGLGHDHGGVFQYVYCPVCGQVEEQQMDEATVTALSAPLQSAGRPVASMSIELVSTCPGCSTPED